MIGNIESIGRLIIFILVFFCITAPYTGPRPVFASGSLGTSLNTADEELATFDEDEASTTDPAYPAGSSFLLHGEQYLPPAYFPDRQKRSLTSHAWMHMIPFAALAILALALTRFSGRRRRNGIPSGDRTKGACE